MQSSLVHNAKKPCLQRRQIFTGFTYYRFIISQPKPLQTTAPIQFTKIQHFTTRLQVFRPLFSAHHASDALRVYFGCTSITKYIRRTASQLPHTQSKTAPRHPKGVLVYFFLKNLFSIRNYWLFSASLLFFKHSASFCSISSLDRSLITIP